jgi:hypothetical protein
MVARAMVGKALAPLFNLQYISSETTSQVGRDDKPSYSSLYSESQIDLSSGSILWCCFGEAGGNKDFKPWAEIWCRTLS